MDDSLSCLVHYAIGGNLKKQAWTGTPTPPPCGGICGCIEGEAWL